MAKLKQVLQSIGSMTFGGFRRNKALNIVLGKYEVLIKGEFTFDKFNKIYFGERSNCYLFDFINGIIKDLNDNERLSKTKAYQDTLNRFDDIDSRFILDSIDL